jgi:[acyl-carrier-protein] S-malonyltransferase
MTNLAFVFPGQGSQSIGMLSELAELYPSVLETFQMVSDCIGYDLWQLTQNGPDSALNQTENTQVAMLTADVAIFQLLQQAGFPKGSYMAGHSLGEYAALVCANAISLTDAAKLVGMRGRLMQETIPLGKGAMAAIVGLSDEQVTKICSLASSEVELVTPANFNAIGQVVIAGHAPAIERAVALADEEGARMAKVIPVSVPCHCSLLVSAANRFEEHLAAANFKKPDISVISNVDLSIYQSPEQIRRLLKEQLFKPVRWVETIQLIQSKGVQSIIECGPGKVLGGLVKRIDKSLSTISVNDNSSLENALSQFTAHEGCCH